jgi:hypothetical protein
MGVVKIYTVQTHYTELSEEPTKCDRGHFGQYNLLVTIHLDKGGPVD